MIREPEAAVDQPRPDEAEPNTCNKRDHQNDDESQILHGTYPNTTTPAPLTPTTSFARTITLLASVYRVDGTGQPVWKRWEKTCFTMTGSTLPPALRERQAVPRRPVIGLPHGSLNAAFARAAGFTGLRNPLPVAQAARRPAKVLARFRESPTAGRDAPVLSTACPRRAGPGVAERPTPQSPFFRHFSVIRPGKKAYPACRRKPLCAGARRLDTRRRFRGRLPPLSPNRHKT